MKVVVFLLLSLFLYTSLALQSRTFKVFYSECTDIKGFCLTKDTEKKTIDIPTSPENETISELGVQGLNLTWIPTTKTIVVNGGFSLAINKDYSYPFNGSGNIQKDCVVVDQFYNATFYFSSMICDYHHELSKADITLISLGLVVFFAILVIVLVFVWIKRKSKLSRLNKKLREQRPLITNDGDEDD